MVAVGFPGSQVVDVEYQAPPVPEPELFSPVEPTGSGDNTGPVPEAEASEETADVQSEEAQTDVAGEPAVGDVAGLEVEEETADVQPEGEPEGDGPANSELETAPEAEVHTIGQ